MREQPGAPSTPPELRPATSFPQAYARLETFLAASEEFPDGSPMWMRSPGNGEQPVILFWGDLRRLFQGLTDLNAGEEVSR